MATSSLGTIGTTQFARGRHVPTGYSHFDGSWAELEALVAKHVDQAKPGYREGVLLVPVPPHRFRSSFVEPQAGAVLEGDVFSRRPDEEPFLRVRQVGGQKQPAGYVEVVIYRDDVLREGGDEPSHDWEIVSVNANPTDKPDPMDPVTMARNYLGLAGGTKGQFTAEQFARAIIWHSKRCHLKIE
jgi:Protein of unknown function (DUF3228)